MTEELFGTAMIRSISFSQDEILRSIIWLYAKNGFELDATYGHGGFYRNIMVSIPKYRFDINPKNETVTKADCKALPLEDGCVATAIFDPPFVITDHKNTEQYLMTKRFSGFRIISELRDMYINSIKEYHRVLKPHGIMVIKCQDMTHGKKNYFIHNDILQWSKETGFIPMDLFILLAKNRFKGNVITQRTARKFHSYFWVLKKRKR